MPTDDPYSEIAEYYDLEHNPFAADVEMYLQFIEAAGDPVLELGCGTGRVLLPIARAGYRIVGVDSSSAMLARCQSAIESEGLGSRATAVLARMSEIDQMAGGPFGVAILAIGALLHATSQDEQLQILAAARRALDPRGQLLIDVFNPTPDRLHSFDGSVTVAGAWELDDDTRIEKFSSQTAHSAGQTIETRFWYDVTNRQGRLTRRQTTIVQRWISSAELILMLRLAGFQDWRVYGSYELDPLGDHSDRLIVAAEVTKTD